MLFFFIECQGYCLTCLRIPERTLFRAREGQILRFKPGCGLSSKGHIIGYSARPRKEDLYTGGSGDDDNNERIKLDEEHMPPPS